MTAGSLLAHMAAFGAGVFVIGLALVLLWLVIVFCLGFIGQPAPRGKR